ncbi:MAG: hypothetical protein LIP77_10780 [Planctomycetes bacterium]|nr:hypothetical protein [Planctomycetota bacterium]
MATAMAAAGPKTDQWPAADLFALIPHLVSVETAAARVGVSGRAIRGLIARNRITSFKVADCNVIYWPSVVEYYRRRGIRLAANHPTA